MVELQETIPTLDEANIAAYAISYDSVETVRKFATARGITFPLLSDTGSEVIKRLGLINPHVRRQHEETNEIYEPRFEGVPYPAAFLIDEQGTVVDRRFHDDYRIRESTSAILAGRFGFRATTGPRSVTPGDVVTVTVSAESDRYSPFQKLWFDVEVVVAPGWHIYGSPTSPGLRAFAVNVVSSAVVRPGEVELLQKPVLRVVAGTEQPEPTYEGTLEARFPVVVATSEMLEIEVRGTVDYQACDDVQCLPPRRPGWSVPFSPRA